MDIHATQLENDYDTTISNPSTLNFREVLVIYKNSSYSNYISHALLTTNLKWLYPSLSIVLILELLTSFTYLLQILDYHIALKIIFTLLLTIYFAIGYIFTKPQSKISNNIVFIAISHFIILQCFFYSAGILSNQSFFYFVSAVVAISLFPALHTKYTTAFIVLNYLIFIAISLSKYDSFSFLSICLNSLYVSFISIFLSSYSFTSKINLLINNKKVSVFAKKMARANEQLNYLNDELEKLSFTDALTKISNRRAYEIESEKLLNHSLRSKTHIALLILDIDNFKQYNDFFGHIQGDECLLKVAQAIQNCYKRKGDIVARFGGEEFVIVLSSVNPKQAMLMADRTLSAIENLKINHPENPASKHVTASIGLVSVIPTYELSICELFKFADKALYKAKNSGKNTYYCDMVVSDNTLPIIKYDNMSDNIKLQNIIKSNSMCSFSLNYNSGKLEFTNDIFQLIDISPAKLNTFSDIHKYIYKDDLDVIENFSLSLNDTTFREINLKFRIVIKNDELLWVNCACFVMRDHDNNPTYIVGSFINTNEKNKYKETISNLLDGSYYYDLKNKTGTISGNIIKYIAISERPPRFSDWAYSIYAYDKPVFDSFIKNIKNNNFYKDNVANLEYRVVLSDGRVVWFLTKNKIYYDIDGSANSIIGTITNLDSLTIYKDFIESEKLINKVSGLPDKNKLYLDLEILLKQKNSKGYLFLIDIDNFTNVNNIFSYSIGNQFLKYFGTLVEKSKIYSGTIYHFEGDLYAALFPHMSDEHAAIQLQSLMKISNDPMIFNDINYQYTLSISGIEYPKFGQTVDELLRNNDISLNKIKTAGKSTAQLFSKKIFDENIVKLQLEKNLRKSIENNMENFILYYHPLLSAKSNKCIGCEALLRWRSPDGTIVLPGVFIPRLESSGLMNRVGEWVLKEASSQCKSWLKDGAAISVNKKKIYIDRDFRISINISAHQLNEDYFEVDFMNHLNSIGLDGKHITLELTEDTLLMDLQKAGKIFNSLRKKGIKVAIDDFGTGYSSLSYFRNLPVDEIKIDRSFIKDIENDVFSQEFVNSIIKITQSIDRVVCVEGIETQFQADLLKSYNVNILQGFLYSMPIPKAEFEERFLCSNAIS